MLWWYLLYVVFDTSVNFQDVISYEPDEVWEVGNRSFVNDKLKHGFVVDPVDVEG